MPSKPTALLRGHTGSVVYLHIHDEKAQMTSVCHNKMVKVSRLLKEKNIAPHMPFFGKSWQVILPKVKMAKPF